MKPIVWIGGACLAILLFGSGLLAGREFPAHHYEPFGSSRTVLYDTFTGRVCDSQLGRVGDPVDATGQPSSDPSAKYDVTPPPGFVSGGVATGKTDANGYAIVEPLPKTFSLPPCNR